MQNSDQYIVKDDSIRYLGEEGFGESNASANDHQAGDQRTGAVDELEWDEDVWIEDDAPKKAEPRAN